MSLWTEHVERWRNCQDCALAATRTRLVLAKGQVPCDALLVGEAPGPSENLIGQPFVGPAGKLLDRIITDAVGMSCTERPRIAFTNLICCIPIPESGASKFEEPPDESVEACASRLVEFFGIANPKLLVCVGSHADYWLMPGKRGRGIDLGDRNDIPTIKIDHPAAVLRANEAVKTVMYRRVVVTLANAFRALASTELKCHS